MFEIHKRYLFVYILYYTLTIKLDYTTVISIYEWSPDTNKPESIKDVDKCSIDASTIAQIHVGTKLDVKWFPVPSKFIWISTADANQSKAGVTPMEHCFQHTHKRFLVTGTVVR